MFQPLSLEWIYASLAETGKKKEINSMNQIDIFFRIFIFPGFLFLLVIALFLHWLDRKLIARFQGRVGPPWYQPLADLVKLFGKEDVLPSGTNLFFAALLPLISFAILVGITVQSIQAPADLTTSTY